MKSRLVIFCMFLSPLTLCDYFGIEWEAGWAAAGHLPALLMMSHKKSGNSRKDYGKIDDVLPCLPCRKLAS